MSDARPMSVSRQRRSAGRAAPARTHPPALPRPRRDRRGVSGGKPGRAFQWILGPIDGTEDFVHHAAIRQHSGIARSQPAARGRIRPSGAEPVPERGVRPRHALQWRARAAHRPRPRRPRRQRAPASSSTATTVRCATPGAGPPEPPQLPQLLRAQPRCQWRDRCRHRLSQCHLRHRRQSPPDTRGRWPVHDRARIGCCTHCPTLWRGHGQACAGRAASRDFQSIGAPTNRSPKIL
jgi:hypothetical protein